MTDEAGTSAPVEAAPAAPAPEAQGQQGVTEAPQGGNPNHDAIRSKLGPSYSLVENELKEMDRLAQERISRSNADAKRYSDLGDFDSLNAAYQLQNRLNSNPLEVYNLLGQYLESQGMSPKQAQAAAAEALDDDGLQAGDSPEAQQLQQLTEAQQRMQDFLDQQQAQQAEAAAEAELDTQMQSIREQNPHFTDADTQRIYRFAYAAALANEGEPDLNAAAAELNALRSELLSTPPASAGAPSLVPVNGGLPPRGEPTNYADQTRQQTQASVVELLKANQGRR